MKCKMTLFLIGIVFLLVSCDGNVDRIKVSIDGEERVLISKEFDKEAYIYEDTDTHKVTMNVKTGQIIIKSVDSISSDILCVDNGYFVGVNIGEFDGWVKYYPYHSNLTDITGGKTVVHENWLDFIKINNRFGYVVTFTPSIIGSGSGSIYLLELIDDEWNWRLFASLDFAPCSVTMAESKIIVAGDGIIAEIDDLGNTDTIIKSDMLTYSDAVLKLNGRYYCVNSIGLYEYDPNMNTEKWFPFET